MWGKQQRIMTTLILLKLNVVICLCQLTYLQRWPRDWKRSVFIPIPKNGNAKECSNYHTSVLFSYAGKVMFKILLAKLQQYVVWELADVKPWFIKGRGTRDQIANICWIIEKAREFQKNIYSASLTMLKPLIVLLFSSSVVSNSLWTHGLQHTRLPWSSPSPRASSSPSLKLMSIESVILSNYLILCHPLLLLPSIFLSIRVFSNESAIRIRWPKYWSFSFSISSSNEYSGLISFRIDQFEFLAVQETLESLLQHHNSKTSILWHSALFRVQLSHPYLTTGKTIALTRQT